MVENNGFNIYWTAEGEVVIEIADKSLVLTRQEAEDIFVDMGHVLHDMDVVKNNQTVM